MGTQREPQIDHSGQSEVEICPSYRRLLSELWKLIFFPKGAPKLFSSLEGDFQSTFSDRQYS